MIHRIVFVFFIAFVSSTVSAQRAEKIINVKDVTRIEKILSADEMGGRKTFTPDIEKAADFISAEFKKAGLGYWDGLNSYFQNFSMINTKSIEVSGDINGESLSAESILAIGSEKDLTINENSGYEQFVIDTAQNLFRKVSTLISKKKPCIIWFSEHNRDNFKRLSFLTRRPVMEGTPTVIFILHDKAEKFNIKVSRETEEQPLTNVIGVLPGKSRKDEFVVFSAHYDHLGIGKPDATGDSIYNGANDDASGTTAVIMLAKYFKALNNNERTIIFVTFTAEEIGGFGSQYFSRHIPSDRVVAMFNIEMIGTDSKWGKNSAYITGFEKSDFGKILQKNLSGSKFHFEPDPYPQQQLFYRSDNATLAALGVPAHTISTSKMDNEPHYHKQSDEFETLDMKNMTEIIRSIALSSKSIISGEDTPSRVEAQSF